MPGRAHDRAAAAAAAVSRENGLGPTRKKRALGLDIGRVQVFACGPSGSPPPGFPSGLPEPRRPRGRARGALVTPDGSANDLCRADN